MEHTGMLEVTGRQGSREHGLAAMTYLVTCLAAKSCHHPLSTLAQVYRGEAVRACSVGVDVALSLLVHNREGFLSFLLC